MFLNSKWKVLWLVLILKLLLLTNCAAGFVVTCHHPLLPPERCVGHIFRLAPWVASPSTHSAGTLGTESLCQPLVNVFLWEVPFKRGPQPTGSAEETAFGCFLVSILQLGQKVSFDLGIKEASCRMLEKVEFWSRGTGRKVGRTQDEQGHLATDGW